MCDQCWNVKTFEAKKRKGEFCDGNIPPIGLDELKKDLTHQWIETKETNFSVFKKAVSGISSDELSFETQVELDGLQKSIQLHVQFV